MPSPGMTARRIVPELEFESVVVMRRRLVVVRALAAVVPQVERGLDGRADVLLAARVVGVVLGGSPFGVHVVHRSALSREGFDFRCPFGSIHLERRLPREVTGGARGSHE